MNRAVAQLGWSNAKVRAGGLETARGSIDITVPPGLVLVDLSDASDPVEGMHELAQLCGPQTRFLAIGSVNDVSLYRQLVALGVADYLVKPVSSELLCEAFASAVRSQPSPSAARTTRLFAFLGARGGVGTTTLAISTAWLLAHEFKLRTALVDLDLHFGNLALSLDLEPGRGLREALENPERTDSMLLASAMVTRATSCRSLPPKSRSRSSSPSTPAPSRRCCRRCRRTTTASSSICRARSTPWPAR